MRNFLSLSVLFIATLIPLSIGAQNCGGLLPDNRVVGNTHYLRSSSITMIIRGDYSYNIEFFNNEKGVHARVTSKNGIELNQNDEIIFADANNNRKTYRFIEMGDLISPKTYQNVLQLDVAATSWFAENNVATVYLLSKTTYELRKLTIPDIRQAEFRSVSVCFNQTLDKSKVQNTVVNTTSTGFKPAAGTTPSVSGTNANGQPNVIRKADISQLNDQELNDLRKELAKTKEDIRAEITAERERGAKEKQKVQEDILAARQVAEQKKAEFANEVVTARQRSQVMIDSAMKGNVNYITESQKKATTEVEKIAKSVGEARERAAQEVQKAQLESSKEVLAAREKAAAEIKATRAKLDEAKQEYADDIAASREASTNELTKIRNEAQKMVESARAAAKVERERTTDEVTTSKKTAAEVILKAQLESADSVARVRERSVLERQKIAFELAEAKRKAAEEKSLITQNAASEVAEIKENVAKQKEASAMEVANSRKKAAETIGETNKQVESEKNKLRNVVDSTRSTSAKEVIAAREKAAQEVNKMQEQLTNYVNRVKSNADSIKLASAISLTGTLETDMKRYDLMHNINTRGTFLVSKTCLPFLLKAENPHVLNLSPPLSMKTHWFENHTAYTMAKYGMSMCVLGMAGEFHGKVAFNALWPRTAIATAAVQNILGGDHMTKHSRTTEILSDAAYFILKRDAKTCTGNFFIDDELLATEGITDLSGYAYTPGMKDSELFMDFFVD